MVVLGLRREVQPAVLPDAEEPHPGERGGGRLAGVTETA